MGWCSGTQIFDAVAGHFNEQHPDEKFTAPEMRCLKIIAQALWDGDWDCEGDSQFASAPQIKKLLNLGDEDG